MQYTIKAVSTDTRQYDTKFGAMVSYKLRLNEVDAIVELSQKATTPAPTEGQTLQGTIDMSGQFGPKFKKEYNQGGGFGAPSQSQNGGGVPTQAFSASSGRSGNSDPFTMYLSYAKDIAVMEKMYDAKGKFNEDLYGEVLDSVMTGAKTLYDGRPGAEQVQTAEPTKQKDAEPSEFDMSQPLDLSNVKPDDIVDVGEIPF